MTYFPLISIPIHHPQPLGTFEIRNGTIIKNDLYLGRGWKKIESKKCTIITLIVSSIFGSVLFSIGCAGLCAANFYIHPGICITSILFGVVLMVPAIIAMKLGFKPDVPPEFNPDNLTSLSTSSNTTFKIFNGPSAPNRQSLQNSSQISQTDIDKEKETYKKKVPYGCYAKFHLSNGNIYYYGWGKVRSVDAPTSYIVLELPPGSKDSVEQRFIGLTFLHS